MWYKIATTRGMFLDDLREPSYVNDESLNIIRDSNAAINFVSNFGCPSFISFDHDLGGDDTAMIFVKWLVNQDMDNNYKIIPKDFKFQVHSQNPIGKQNIESYLNGYLSHREKELENNVVQNSNNE